MRIAYAFLCRKSKRSTGFYFFDSGLILLAVFLLLILILPHTAYSAQISLEWDANTEPNLAGYKIHYGVSSGDYDTTVDIGNYTSCTISELQEGQTYYFAASAYDLNGNQSGYSNEVLTQIHTTDTDGDGLSDDDETHIYGTDPNKADTDDDGMPDGWEVENGLFPLEDDANLDQDGDGFSNREEYVSATDPNDASSNPPDNNDGSDPPTSVKIWLEAESGDLNSPMVNASDDAAASSGEYIWIQEDQGDIWSPSEYGGYASYTFEVPISGDYLVWGRVKSGSESDSFFVSMDDGTYAVWDTQRSDTWIWDLVNNREDSADIIFYLEAGAHTLVFKQREDGTKIDKIFITNDVNYVPSL